MAAYINAFNGSKIAWGLSTVGMQLGARFVVGDLTEMQNKILASKLAKRVIMCGMIFVATRDIMISVVLTVAIHAVLSWLINENSAMCVIPSNLVPAANQIAKEHYDAALKIVQQYNAEHNITSGRQRVRPPRLHHPMRTNSLF